MPSYNDFPPKLRNTPISQLDISARTRNACIRNDVLTIGDFLRLGRKGMQKLRNIGSGSIDELYAAVTLYMKEPSEKADISGDQENQSELSSIGADSPVNLLEHIVTITEAILKASRKGEREFQVLVHRFGLKGAAIYTLEEIGAAEGVTRERV